MWLKDENPCRHLTVISNNNFRISPNTTHSVPYSISLDGVYKNTINNFSISKSTAELGEKLIGLILNWSYNKTPTYQKLDNVLIDAE